MADKPSRALVLYAAGHAALLSPAAAGHLDAFASLASCGLLSLRSPTPNDAGESSSTIVELAQLLDVYDELCRAKNGETSQETGVLDRELANVPKISERFMGLRAAMITNCPRVSSFASNLGLHVLRTEDLIVQSDSSNDDSGTRIINRTLGLLGFLGGLVQEVSEFDLVFVHVAAETTKSKLGKLGRKTDLNRLDKLVGAIMEAVPIGSAIASRIHMSIILSYGSAFESEEQCSLISNSSTEKNSDLSLLRPRQSYSMKAGSTLHDIRHHHPMLLAQWQVGVTRMDLAKTFSFEEFIKNGGNLAMLAERFLHEVAFKLWKAPKYGA